jgi:hypothetical protein
MLAWAGVGHGCEAYYDGLNIGVFEMSDSVATVISAMDEPFNGANGATLRISEDCNTIITCSAWSSSTRPH